MEIKIGDGVYLKTSKLQYFGTVLNSLNENGSKSYKIHWNDDTATWEAHIDIIEYRKKYLDLLAK